MNQVEASRLARKALELWSAGQADLAVPLYRQALELADPAHYSTPQYHEEFAGALSSLGLFSEAGEHYQLAVSLELAQDDNEFSPSVIVARYFLAEHFLQQGDAAAALEAVEPSLKDGLSLEWLLRYVRALSLHALGDREKALYEADLAIRCAPSEAKRQDLSRLFNEKMGFEMGYG
jgi:tetratricopeptide (TPR) repeat protein